MAGEASYSHGIAGRYATALFEIAKEEKSLDSVEKDLTALAGAFDASPELSSFIQSPAYGRDDQTNAISAITAKMGLSPVVANTVSLMASKGRLFAVPALIEAVSAMIAEERGEMTAEVTSAKALTKAQSDKLAATLKSRFGKDIKIDATVDESIIGGLIVKVGSKMIDSSIASKLSSLQKVMKEAG